MAEGKRFPAGVYGVGDEPDPRFSMANERTFLAWISAALGLLSVGVGLEALAVGLHPGYRRAAALLLIVMGMACPVQAWFSWAKVERALRERQPLPAPTMAPWLAGGIVLVGVLVVLGVFLP